MENRVGIITVYGENNYGNKFQNYACLKIFEKFGCTVKTIKGIQSSVKPTNKSQVKKIIKRILSIFSKYKRFKYELIRERKFKDFSKQRLNITKEISLKKINNKELTKYNILSVGSDQVWNDEDFDFNDINYFTLGNINNVKKISLAASIGKEKLKKENEEIFKKNLKKFDFLSCRETMASDYIQSLIGKKCITLPDPTFYLKKDEWKVLEKKPNWLKYDNYIFCYFLGGTPKEIAKNYDKNFTIIDIMDKNSIYYTTSPEEMLYLLRNAELVLTDSFHACVFSLIYDKKFIIYERKIQNCKMTTRIENLFNIFKKELIFGEINDSKVWNNKEKIFNDERKKIEDFITDILD